MQSAMEGLEGGNHSTCHWILMTTLLNAKNLSKEEVVKTVTGMNELNSTSSLDLTSRVTANMQTALLCSVHMETVIVPIFGNL